MARLTAIFDMKDQMSKKLDKMSQGFSKLQKNADKIKQKMGTLTDRVHTAHIRAKDNASGVIDAIRGDLNGLHALAGSIAIGAVATAGFQKTIGAASQLEQNTISMEHFMGVGNPNADASAIKSMTAEYMKALQKNALETPFGDLEIQDAGRRALQVGGGDTKQALEVLKIAEDMAALNPGKTLEQSMEAIADAKMGEFERMKEFGLKYSADEFKKSGWEGFMTEANALFQGGADKLSTSAAGMWMKITGAIDTGLQQMGIGALEILKPQLEQLADAFSSGALDDFVAKGSKALAGFAKVVVTTGKFIYDNWNTIVTVAQTVGTAIVTAFAVSKFLAIRGAIMAIGGLGPLFMSLLGPVTYIAGAVALLFLAWKTNFLGIRDTLQPVIDAIKLGFDIAMQVIGAFVDYMQGDFKGAFETMKNLFGPEIATQAMEVFGSIRDFITSVWNGIVTIIQGAWSIISNVFSVAGPIILQVATMAFQGIWSVVSFVFPYIISIVTQVWNHIVTAFTAISSFISTIMPYIKQIIAVQWAFLGPIIKFALDTIVTIVKVGFEYIKTSVEVAMTFLGNIIETGWNLIKGIFTAALQLLTGDWEGAWETLKKTGKQFMDDIIKLATDWAEGTAKLGKQFIQGIIDGFLGMWDSLKETASQIWDSITGIFSKKQTVTVEQKVTKGKDGSHYNGLNYVPFNGYMAELHRGEMVLTRKEAEAYRGNVSDSQKASLLGVKTASNSSTAGGRKTDIHQLVGTVNVYNEADENRLIDKLRRLLEEEISTGGEASYAG